MPTYICKSKGNHPEGLKNKNSGLCPMFDSEGHNCSLEPEKKCRFRQLLFSESEIHAKEHVEVPAQIEGVRRALSGLDLYEIFSETVYQAVHHAMKIIDKLNNSGEPSDRKKAMSWAYWQDPDAIEWDMAQLSSDYANIAGLHAKLKSELAAAHSAQKLFRSRKFSSVHKSFAQGVRSGKQTDKVIENEVEIDPEYQEVIGTVHKAEEAVRMLEAALTSIDKHIQVLKKRRETLVTERMLTKELPT